MRDDGPTTTTRRQFLQGAAATAAGLATLGLPATTVTAATGPTIIKRPGQVRSRPPNFLIITVDEQRFPPVYESPQLAAFRAQYLTTQQTLQQTGISFRRHYAASTACAPSRTSIYTGQYPSLHGVSQVDGAAKGTTEPDMFWLDFTTVPTMGDYFLYGGYRTYYRGKWHISHADIIEPGTTDGGWNGLASYDILGRRDPTLEQLYEQAERLSKFGFAAWIGREPHGANPLDSGSSAGIYKPTGQKCSSRDQAFAGQTIDLLQRLDADPDDGPWLVVSSFVNPHDITLFGLFARLGNLFPQIQYTFDFTVGPEVPSLPNLFDQTLFQRTNREDLATKPRAQESYRDSYAQWLQPILSPEYFRFYYQLHRNVDIEMGRVYDALRRTRFFQDTIVVFLSDHGDLLGAHGNMHQKWYTAYDETARVPLVISSPRLTTQGQAVDIPTSHIDLMPTLLGLAGLDPELLRRFLSVDHTEARQLVGRDLSGVVRGTVPAAAVETPIYFMTDDDTARGISQNTNFVGLTTAVIQPNHLDTVIVQRGGQLWKYTEYRDDPNFWTNPPTQDTISQPTQPPPPQPGTYTQPFTVTVKNQPVQPQPRDFELYNVSADPMELNNLALDPAFIGTKAEMAALLQEQRRLKRLTPLTVSPSGPALNQGGEGWQPNGGLPPPGPNSSR